MIIIASLLFLINPITIIDREALAQQNNGGDDKEPDKPGIDFSAITIGIITSSVVIVSAIVTAYLNKRGNIEAQIKNDLRNKRVDTYSELFMYMLPLAIFSDNPKYRLTYIGLKDIQEQFTKWYYMKKGGLLMSRQSQIAYIDFQIELKQILGKCHDERKEITPLEDNDSREIKIRAFDLRLALLKDVDVDVSILLLNNKINRIKIGAYLLYIQLHKIRVFYLGKLLHKISERLKNLDADTDKINVIKPISDKEKTKKYKEVTKLFDLIFYSRFDLDMITAITWADEIGLPPTLPKSLDDLDKRAKLVDHIDSKLIQNSFLYELDAKEKAKCLGVITNESIRFISDVENKNERNNLVLRLLAGCISAAKGIALKTDGGPDSSERRKVIFRDNIDIYSDIDPIYEAGVEAAPAFKRRRNQPYSFEGIPETSPVKKHP
jgi:hypothetical protein